MISHAARTTQAPRRRRTAFHDAKQQLRESKKKGADSRSAGIRER
jgi:hypothetical protein